MKLMYFLGQVVRELFFILLYKLITPVEYQTYLLSIKSGTIHYIIIYNVTSSVLLSTSSAMMSVSTIYISFIASP
jgi:hypothetical protein